MHGEFEHAQHPGEDILYCSNSMPLYHIEFKQIAYSIKKAASYQNQFPIVTTCRHNFHKNYNFCRMNFQYLESFNALSYPSITFRITLFCKRKSFRISCSAEFLCYVWIFWPYIKIFSDLTYPIIRDTTFVVFSECAYYISCRHCFYNYFKLLKLCFRAIIFDFR